MQVCRLDCHNFADTSPGVVEQKKQCPVADSGTRIDIHRIEQRLHLLLLKVSDSLVFGAFQGDGANPLALEDQGRLLSGNKGEEDTDGRQSCIACSWGAASGVFKMIEESQYERLIDFLDVQRIGAFSECVGRIAQKQLDRIAVSPNRAK